MGRTVDNDAARRMDVPVRCSGAGGCALLPPDSGIPALSAAATRFWSAEAGTIDDCDNKEGGSCGIWAVEPAAVILLHFLLSESADWFETFDCVDAKDEDARNAV